MMSFKPVRHAMQKWAIGAMACTIVLTGCEHQMEAGEVDPRWMDLIDGDTLEGWTQVNGDAPYEIADGTIRGTNVLESPNSFLASDETFSDFILEFESRSIGDANSGVQFRTDLAPGTWSGVVGYQLDIDPSERRWTGGIYHEGVHVWRHAMARNPECQAAYQHEAWNTYRIEASGSVIATWVNGVPCAHMVGEHHTAGFIALQVHAIGQEEKYLGSFTEWRDMRILKAPNETDFWTSKRAGLIEGWLPEEVSALETKNGWTSVDFSTGAAALEIGSEAFEVVLDVQMDDAANGHLDYAFGGPDSDCSGRYQIRNDVALGDEDIKSNLMGSLPDTIEATNLSEPGRPKRVYSDDRWNRVRIVVTEDRIEHWLNSVKVVDYAKCAQANGGSDASKLELKMTTQAGQIISRNMKLKTSAG